MKSFLIKLVTSVFIGAFFSAWVVQNVNLRELATYPIDFTLIGLAIALSAAALHLRAFRWQKLLLPFIPLTYWQVFKALLVGHAMNVVLPARLGELFRVNLCKKWYALSRSVALATLIWERIADGVTVVSCLIIGALSMNSLSHHEEVVGLIFIGTPLFFGTLFIFFLLRRHSLAHLLRNWPKLLARVLPFQKGVQEVPLSTLMGTIGLSLCVWTLEGLSLWAIVRGIGIALTLLQTLLLVGVVSLSTLLPSPPGFLGTLQFAFGISLLSAGCSAATGVLAATLTQIFIFGCLAVTGMLLLGWTALKKPRLDVHT